MSTPQGPGGAIERAKQGVALERVASALPVEVGTTAAAAQVKAMVEARFVMAIKLPRNMEQVRQNLLHECSRPSFALEDTEGKGNGALYRRPVGGGTTVEGLGIRFAEVALRCMKNIQAGDLTIQEDDMQRVKLCYVIDFENNVSWEDTVTISKTVERKEPRTGDVVLSVRTNSTGQQTYTILASEDALTTKEGALVSKKLRTLALRLIPGDLQDECISKIKEVRAKRITEDPDAAIRKVTDGMARQNISVVMLEEYLGHPVQQMTPAEISNLQSLYAALRDGETTWAEVLANKEDARQRQPQAKAPERGVEAAKAKMEQPAQPQPVPFAPQPPNLGVQPQQAPPPPAPVQPPPPPQPVQPPPPPAAPPQAPPPPPPAAPVQQEQPAPAPPPQAPPAAPQWAAQPTTQPEAPPQPVAQPTPPPAPVQPQGKVIKGVQFPAVMTRAADGSDAWNDEQLARAEAALEGLNQRQGKNFKLESTVKNWFQLDLNQLSGATLEAIILVLTNWQ